jgi:endoglucanase
MKKQQAPQHRRRRLRLAVGTPPPALIAAGVIAYGTVFGTFGDDAKPQASAATAPVPGNAMAAVAAMS